MVVISDGYIVFIWIGVYKININKFFKDSLGSIIWFGFFLNLFRIIYVINMMNVGILKIRENKNECFYLKVRKNKCVKCK